MIAMKEQWFVIARSYKYHLRDQFVYQGKDIRNKENIGY